MSDVTEETKKSLEIFLELNKLDEVAKEHLFSIVGLAVLYGWRTGMEEAAGIMAKAGPAQ